jgi:dUTP pyrophosphatase
VFEPDEEEEMILMRFRRVRAGARVPEYMTAGAAGMDLAAAVDGPVVLGPGERVAVPTGLVVEIPAGYEGQVRPRSGLARRHGIGMVNAPGTIDSDYRGEVQVLLVNLGQEAYTVAPGDRIAQLVIAPVTRVALEEVKDGAELTASARGTGGFGHTG